ncbi:MAG: hypothetical protein IT462_07955 [Planctomycetes bacterium]|nr:hypothetical protein [Planctomycetota bacterium]
MITSTEIADFNRFVRDAEKLIGQRVVAFQAFIEAATPLAIKVVQQQVEKLRTGLTYLAPWWTTHDFVAALGAHHAEYPYSELLAWMIRRETHPETFEQRVLAVLKLAAPSLNSTANDIHDVRTQVVTSDGGTPDIVIFVGTTAVIIEAKTRSLEHKTPAGQMQTKGYPSAVAALFGLSPTPEIAFLTLDRSGACNEDATLLTWADCALALAKAISKDNLDPVFAGLLATAISHFVRACLSSKAEKLLTELLSGVIDRWTDSLIERIGEVQELYARLEAAL